MIFVSLLSRLQVEGIVRHSSPAWVNLGNICLHKYISIFATFACVKIWVKLFLEKWKELSEIQISWVGRSTTSMREPWKWGLRLFFRKYQYLQWSYVLVSICLHKAINICNICIGKNLGKILFRIRLMICFQTWEHLRQRHRVGFSTGWAQSRKETRSTVE